MQGIKPCSITTARRENKIKNKFKSARTTALALRLLLRQYNTMPNGIRKKTNIGKMERNGLMSSRFVFPYYVKQTDETGGVRMLRSIKKVFDMVKQEDPDTAITVHTIRMWCKEGKIKYLTAGNKILVDVQSLMDYIAIKE